MHSKKEDFLNQLQFELGHRWPDLDIDSIRTISDLKDFILKKHSISKWQFLKFLPVYTAVKEFIEKQTGQIVSTNFDLNSLNTENRKDLTNILVDRFGTPLTLRRPVFIQKVIYLLPIVLILGPLLISTYLLTVKDVTGWIFLSAVLGFFLTVGAFKITESTKKHFSPNTLLEYSKAFYVVNNQFISENPSSEVLSAFLCNAAERFYKQPFTISSEIPLL